MNVVLTGGTRGLGRSVVNQFVKGGHRVLFTSRNRKNILGTLDELNNPQNAIGLVANVAHPMDWDNIQDSVERNMPEGVDVWINNAAVSDGNTSIVDTADAKLKEIIDTNLYGTIAGSKMAIKLMSRQSPDRMGHIFNISGAGSDGSASPEYAVYGSTKAAIVQFTRSLQHERGAAAGRQGIHVISPGMMATGMLAENVCERKRTIYNILCEDPEVVASQILVDINRIVRDGSKSEYLHYLTPLKVLYRLLTAAQRRDRFFK
jgi:chlorophyll(ide) b reductase